MKGIIPQGKPWTRIASRSIPLQGAGYGTFRSRHSLGKGTVKTLPLHSFRLGIKKHAVHHDPYSYSLLKTVPGIGPMLGLVILYEVQDISRFENVGNFISYSRLVKCAHESAGKKVKGKP